MNDITLRNKLVIDHLPQSNKMAMLYHSKYRAIDRDELQSIAAMALVDSAIRYEPGRGVLFWTFAKHHVCGAMTSYIKQQLRYVI